MPGLIGKKLGMTNLFDENRKAVACTLIEVSANVVTQLKNTDKEGYNAVQLSFGSKKEKNTSKPLAGHFAKANAKPMAISREFDLDPASYALGDKINVDLFQAGDFVDVVGTSKGKGFAGVVKRHHFAGVGGQTHGQHNRLRAPGSMGSNTYPARVWKGKKLGGHMGDVRVKVQNLQVMKVIADKNLLVVSGSVPGAKGSFVLINK